MDRHDIADRRSEAATDPFEEQLGGATAEPVGILGNGGDARFDDVGDLDVVERDQRDLVLQLELVQRPHRTGCGEVLSGEERGRCRPGVSEQLVHRSLGSGGVYDSDDNDWRIVCYGGHLGRDAEWYGDACAVPREVGIR